MRRNISLLFITVIIFFLPDQVLSQPRLSEPEDQGYKSFSDIRIYYDRADAERDRDMWLSTAMTGIGLLSESEREKGLFEMKERLARWEWGKMEKELPFPEVEALLSEIEKNNNKYLYTHDGGGLVFDENGKPVYKGLEGLEGDTEDWENGIKSFISGLLSDWENRAEIKYDEIQGFEGEYSDEINPMVCVSFSEYRDRIKSEFEYIYLSGKKSFITRRSLDSFSLKKESKGESAGEEAERRIVEVEESLREASMRLENDMNDLKTLPADKIELDMNEWEESFRTEFENGIKRWEEAEKDFLGERIRWETEAKEGYIKAEEDWDRAILDFTDARRRWASGMKVIIEEGREYWEEREYDFFNSYREVTEEIEEASLKEKTRFEREVSSYLSIYTESRNVEAMASDNIGYLEGEISRIESYKRGQQKYVDRYRSEIAAINSEISRYKAYISSSKDKDEDDDHKGGINLGGVFIRLYEKKIKEKEALLPDLREKLERAVEFEGSKDNELNAYMEELSFWRNAEDSYKENRIKAEENLIALEEEINSGVYGGDEYESELAILKDRRDILLRKLEIAERVYQYSLDSSSGRERKAETEKKYEEALENFNALKDSYLSKIEDLDQFVENELAGGEASIQGKKEALCEAEILLEKAREEYESGMEIFRLKDSSLLETSIANLEDDIEDYYTEDMESSWSEYFRHMERSLRNEKGWEAEELKDDLMGIGEEDNHTDIGILEGKKDFLEGLVIDYDNPDIEALKTNFTLNGFDTDSPFFLCFFDSLENGMDAGGRFYYEIIKLESETEYMKTLKGIELLSLSESEKSAEEIVSDIEEELDEKRGGLFEYSGGDILSFLSKADFESLNIDIEDPDLLGKIREIAILEGEKGAVEKYSPLCLAFSPFEREALYRELSEMTALAGEDGGKSTGLSVMFENSSDVMEFYEKLMGLDNVPVYVFEALEMVMGAVIKSNGFVIEDDTSSDEAELEDYTARIENYNGDDVLSLEELEGKRDTLSLKIDSINAAKTAYKKSLDNDYPEKGKSASENILVRALDTLLMELDFVTNQDMAKGKRDIALSLENENRSNEDKLAELKDKLSKWENEQEVYFEENIAEKKSVLEERRGEVSDLRLEFQVLLDEFTSLTEQYRGKKNEVDNAFDLYSEGRWELYEAEELKDYASSPYKLENTDPLSVLEERRDDFERSDEIYSELVSIKESIARKEYKDILDSEYLEYLDEKKELLSRVNYISESVDILGEKISEAQEKAGQYYTVMKDSMKSMFRYELNFSPDLDSTDGEITDFSSLTGEEQIKDWVAGYFSQENADVIYSNDTLRWAYKIFENGYSGALSLIKRFGIAYYSEFKSKVNVAIYSDQNYQMLEKGKYAGGDPEKYADNYAKSVLLNIESDSELNRLYSFFKVMQVSGKTTFDSAFMGKDVSEVAHDYLWDRSKKEEKHIKKHHKWSNFWNKTAKKMRRMRHNMTDVNGSEERNMLASSVFKVFEARDGFLSKRSEIALLTGGSGDGEIGFEDFTGALEEVSGGLPSEGGSGFLKSLEEIYSRCGSDKKTSSYTLANEVLSFLSRELSEKEEALSLLDENLKLEREIAIERYREDLSDPEADTSLIKESFINLFYNPSYSSKESAEGGIEASLLSYSGDLKGRERSLRYASVDLLKLFSSSVDISTASNDMVMRNSYLELLDKRGEWEERIAELYETGAVEWSSGFDNLIGKRKRWQEEFRKEALQKEELWNDKYNLLSENKQRWVSESTAAVSRGESLRLARETGIRAEKMIAETESIIIPDIKPEVSLGSIVERVTDQSLLSSLIESARYYSENRDSSETIIASYLPSIGSFSPESASLDSYAESLTGEIKKRSALLKALKMAKTVEEVEDGIIENINLANKSTEKSISDTLEGKGYRRSGDLFTRKAVIDISLLGGIEEELHEIKGYKYFKAPDFETGVDLSKKSLEGISSGEIEMKVDKAVKNLERYSDLIFGGKTSKDTTNWKGFDDDFRSYTEKMEERFASSKQYGKYKDTKGLFYMHLGYAPVMKSKNPEKVKTEGYGEYGRIYRLFLRNEARLGRGLASFEVPCYSQKLWDDDKNNDGESDGLLGAPSIRSIGSIAMTIASGGAGAWAFAVNMLDDAVFTAMDVGNGITDWDDGMLSLGKQAGTSLVTSGIGGRFDKIETNNFLTSTAAAGVKTGSLNLAGTAINSFDLNSKGLYFNTNSFAGNWQDDLYGKGAVSGYISSMGAAGLNSTLTGFYREDLAYGKALSGSIAGTAASMYEYNALGSTKLNVLNTSDILSFLGADKLKEDYGGVGLLEFGIGDGGSVFNFGTEGQNVSASNLSAAYKGINTYYQNMKIYSSEENNIREAKVGMRALYSRGGTDEEAMKLYKNLLSGEDNLRIDKSIKGEAETVENTETGGRTILLNNIGKGKMNGLHLGIVLGHEAYRDGYKVGSVDKNGNVVTLESNSRETIDAVKAHVKMAEEIEKDYNGFLDYDLHLKTESQLLDISEKTGDSRIFEEYAAKAYNSKDGDFFFPEFNDFGMTQNADEGNDNITLGYDEEYVNEQRFKSQYERYLEKENLSGEIFSQNDFEKLWKNDKEIRKKYKVDLYTNETISESGCNLYSLLYIQNAITSNKLTGKEANEMLKDNNQFASGNLIYTDSSKALEILTEEKYSFDFESYSKDKYSEKTIIDRLTEAKNSNDLEAVRIYTGSHFTVLKDFTVARDKEGSSYISGIEVLNSWKGGKSNYKGSEIERFDFFKAEISETYKNDLRKKLYPNGWSCEEEYMF